MSFFLRTTVAILLALPVLLFMFYFLEDPPSGNVAAVEVKVGNKLISIRSESLSTTTSFNNNNNKTKPFPGPPQQSMAIPKAATPITDQKQKTEIKNENNTKQNPSPLPPPSMPPPATTTIVGKKQKPIILIGTNHKTGTVLAMHVFRDISKASKLRYKKMVSSLDKANLLDQLSGLDIALDMHWQLTWKDLQQLTNAGRPYKFVYFTRHPLVIPVSAYSYHLKGPESWLFDRKDRYFSKGNSQSTWCNKWKHRCQKYGEFIPDLCQQDKPAPIDQLICQSNNVLTEELSRNSSFTKEPTYFDISHYDALHKLNRLDGVRLESARAVGQVLDMAAAVESTKNDPNTLTVDLDIVVKNHKLCWSQILSFVGLDPAKHLKFTNKHDVSRMSKSDTHVTRNENKTDIQAEVKKPLVQEAYQPMITIMEQLDMTCHY